MASEKKRNVLKIVKTRPRRQRKEGKGGVKVNQGLFTPDQMSTTLRWSFSGSASSSATYGENVFSGNGLFDPGLTASSSQPVGFDQYALWYNRYRVSGSKIAIQFQLFSNSATPTATIVGGRVVLYPSNTLAAASSFQEAMAQPRAITKEVGALTPLIFTESLSSVKALGFNGSKVDSTDSAGVAAQPTAQWYWHLGFISGAYTNVETIGVVTIDYKSHFYYRVTQPLSLLDKLQKELNLAIKNEIKRREDLPPEPKLLPENLNDKKDDGAKVSSVLDQSVKACLQNSNNSPRIAMKSGTQESKIEWDIEESDEDFMKGLRKRGPY